MGAGAAAHVAIAQGLIGATQGVSGARCLVLFDGLNPSRTESGRAKGFDASDALAKRPLPPILMLDRAGLGKTSWDWPSKYMRFLAPIADNRTHRFDADRLQRRLNEIDADFQRVKEPDLQAAYQSLYRFLESHFSRTPS